MYENQHKHTRTYTHVCRHVYVTTLGKTETLTHTHEREQPLCDLYGGTGRIYLDCPRRVMRLEITINMYSPTEIRRATKIEIHSHDTEVRSGVDVRQI